jgi:hypothetical protein
MKYLSPMVTSVSASLAVEVAGGYMRSDSLRAMLRCVMALSWLRSSGAPSSASRSDSSSNSFSSTSGCCDTRNTV